MQIDQSEKLMVGILKTEMWYVPFVIQMKVQMYDSST